MNSTMFRHTCVV